MEVRAYVTEPQLAAIRLGQEARVSIDSGGGPRQTVSGIDLVDLVARGVHADADPDRAKSAPTWSTPIKIRVANDNGVAEDRHARRRAVRRESGGR